MSDEKKTIDRLAIYFDVSRLYRSEIEELIAKCEAIENVSNWTEHGQTYLGATIDVLTFDDGFITSCKTEEVVRVKPKRSGKSRRKSR